jgi:hypothetical protein
VGVLAGRSAAGLAALASAARAQGSPAIIRVYPRRAGSRPTTRWSYRRPDEFSGWPHTSGFWDMGGGELLQNVTSNYTDYPERRRDQPRQHRPRRPWRQVGRPALDRLWPDVDGAHPTVNMFASLDPRMARAKTIGDLRPIDFLDKDVIFSNSGAGFGTPDGRTDVRVSRDRGRSWSPPIPVPLDGLHSLSGMNSHLVRPDGTALIWLMEVDKEGWNRHPCVYALPPRGTDFHFTTFITPKHDPYGAADGATPHLPLRRPSLVLSARLHAAQRPHPVRLRCQRDPTG